MAAWNELPAASAAECAALVDSADRLRWSAPELAVQFAARSLRSGVADVATTTRAQVLLGTSLVRLGRHAEAVEPALTALPAVTSGGLVERAAAVRVALAACARVLGEPLAGCELLRPVLRSTTAAPATRALALGQFVACAAHIGRRDDLEDALAEADRLLASDEALGQDGRKVERALLCVRAASYHRRHGDTEAATDSARDGLALLNRLSAVGAEGGLARARLVLEMVCALLDDGDIDEATVVAATVLGEPVRATSALALGRLRLAMATRVHLPSGQADYGRSMLVDVVRLAERHGLDSLQADAWTFLAHAEEEAGHPSDALHALRSARAAEYRYLRSTATARGLLLTEVGAVRDPESAVSLLRATVRPTAAAQVATGSTESTGVVRDGAGKHGASQAGAVQGKGTPTKGVPVKGAQSNRAQSRNTQSRSTQAKGPQSKGTQAKGTRGGKAPEMFAVTLVRVWPKGTAEPVEPEEPPLPVGGEVTLNALAIHVRDLAPADAELLRSDRGEFAVLLPSTTLAEADALASAIREAAADAQWLIDDQGQELTISTGVAALPGTVDGPHEGIEALLLAARAAVTVAEPASPAPAVLRRTDRLRRSPTTAKTIPLTEQRRDSGSVSRRASRVPVADPLADDTPTIPDIAAAVEREPVGHAQADHGTDEPVLAGQAVDDAASPADEHAVGGGDQSLTDRLRGGHARVDHASADRSVIDRALIDRALIDQALTDSALSDDVPEEHAPAESPLADPVTDDPLTDDAPTIPAPTSHRTAADALSRSTEDSPGDSPAVARAERVSEQAVADEAHPQHLGRRAARRAKVDDAAVDESTVDDAGVRSVLSRFGVTAEGGGRRRAPEGDDSYFDPNALVGTDLPAPPMLPASLEPDADDPRWARSTIPAPPEPDPVPLPPDTPPIPEPAEPDPIPPAHPEPAPPIPTPPTPTPPGPARPVPTPPSPSPLTPELPEVEPPAGRQAAPRLVGQDSGVRAAGQVTVDPAASADDRRAIDFAARLRGLPRTVSIPPELPDEVDEAGDLVDADRPDRPEQAELPELPTRRRRTPSGRRERTNPSGLADLLAEALVAFKATQPDRPAGEDPPSPWSDDWPKAPGAGEPDPVADPRLLQDLVRATEFPRADADDRPAALPEPQQSIGTQVQHSGELRKPREEPAKTHPTGELPRWSRLSTESHWPEQPAWPGQPADGTGWAADARAAEPGDRTRSRRADRATQPNVRGRHRSSEWAPADFESG
ncbi:diguanylate cyclase domain-containing protein [Actinokineospora diospyrosa]|uniref:Diguanylate cyclase, GGDEF domain n=1 Tax=Actinokineospora diospyrosa TaxID=103728 RepID=A0ABT1IAL8_9PSEU|nr:diguanylate cyclase [Actinokineospora diospyrosa]MCP2269666.1 Diguanylate cyclase, GGDEF domain [Actinokineospora diospyrosa]